MNGNFVEQLDKQLRDIETSAREYDEGNKDAAIKQLEKLGLLNEKQKGRLKESLEDLSDQLAREPPPQNVAVVQEMKPDIDAAVKLGLN